MRGVTFVVPIHNGAASIDGVLNAIVGQADGRPMEIIVVDDGSQDDSRQRVHQFSTSVPLRLIATPGLGAAAAINAGIRAARYPIVCQIDQDVIVQPGWMQTLVDELEHPALAAVQGQYQYDPSAGLCARLMGLDLQQRYAAVRNVSPSHVCTGNSAYSVEAIRNVGFFDETLGYGYDNDMSYRLAAAGYELKYCPRAASIHRWREGLGGYLSQQYGFGYGRLDVVAKHPRRAGGDSVSPLLMMMHPLLMSIGLMFATAAMLAALIDGAWQRPATIAAVICLFLAVERLVAGIAASRRFRSATPLWFPVLHLLRDVTWAFAMLTWIVRKMRGHGTAPTHSMRPRPAIQRRDGRTVSSNEPVICLIPVHNEAATLGAVIGELRTLDFPLDVLVVDDGSTDETASLIKRLGVRWLSLPERMGIGVAMRAGIRYASRLGYRIAVRVDGDGQHCAADVRAVLAPVLEGRADMALGARRRPLKANHERREGLSLKSFMLFMRFMVRFPGPAVAALLRRTLGVCISLQTGNIVTDPTTGFCAIGPYALQLLSEHHPTGYPEPELRLLLNRNGLTVVEVPVRARRRLAGRSSLTFGRMTSAAARVLLAMIVVPFRRTVADLARDGSN